MQYEIVLNTHEFEMQALARIAKQEFSCESLRKTCAAMLNKAIDEGHFEFSTKDGLCGLVFDIFYNNHIGNKLPLMEWYICILKDLFPSEHLDDDTKNIIQERFLRFEKDTEKLMCNTTNSRIIQAAIMHLIFYTEFKDLVGSDVIAHLISNKIIFSSEIVTNDQAIKVYDNNYFIPSYSLTKQFKENYEKYIRLISHYTKHIKDDELDISEWCLFFLSSYHDAIKYAAGQVNCEHNKALAFAKLVEYHLSELQKEIIIDYIKSFDNHLSRYTIAEEYNVSHDTAARNLEQLVQYGILQKVKSDEGRAICYDFRESFYEEYIDAFYYNLSWKK